MWTLDAATRLAVPPVVPVGNGEPGTRVMMPVAGSTEIVAPRAGTVTAILVEDGQPVEYGEPLLVIE